jgi:hypothetical protein
MRYVHESNPTHSPTCRWHSAKSPPCSRTFPVPKASSPTQAGPQHHCEGLITPYPMTRLCVRVGGEEFNSHCFAPYRRVADMVEGSLGAVHNRLVRCTAVARRFPYLEAAIERAPRGAYLPTCRDPAAIASKLPTSRLPSTDPRSPS